MEKSAKQKAEAIADYFKSAGVFYLATIDEDQARVRPFGAVLAHEGRVYFCTNNKKKVFKQLAANPNVEISTMAKDDTWIRLNGKAIVDNSDVVRKAMLEAYPSLSGMYKIGDGIFEVFYLEDMAAMVYSFKGEPEEF